MTITNICIYNIYIMLFEDQKKKNQIANNKKNKVKGKNIY